MSKFLEISLKVLFVVSLIAFVICTIWFFVNRYTLPIWLPMSIVIYNILFAIYMIIKKKRNE